MAVVYGAACSTAAAITAISPLHTGDGDVHALVVPALAWSFGIAAVCGAAGGILSRPLEDGNARRLIGALAGGWSMLAYGVVAAFLALMLLTAVKPSYSQTYLIGFRQARTGGGAAKLLHNAALLPNGSVWALSVSMGACGGIYGVVRIDVLCYSKFPSGIGQASAPMRGTEALPVPTTSPHIPAILFIFALVPPAAVLLGGAAAERFAEARSAGRAVLAGGLAGVAFGPIMAFAAFASGVSIRLSGGGMSGTRWVFFGPQILRSGLVALAWGIPGGALGALGARKLRARAARGSAPPAAGR